MKPRKRALTLVEVLTLIAAAVVLMVVLCATRTSRCGGLSKRLVCGSNLKSIGTSCKIYANENAEQWPVPPFSDRAGREGRLDYLNDGPAGEQAFVDPGQVGWRREQPTISDPGPLQEGTRALSTTRAFWLLVRSGDVTVQSFVCPTSNDPQDPTIYLDHYYDFASYRNVNYGYQVPFGPSSTRPRDGADNRMIFAADKGPYSGGAPRAASARGDGTATVRSLPTAADPPQAWRPYNSPNHGGPGISQGQNCLYADGHTSFQRTPIVGIDQDNIYTLMRGPWTQGGHNRIHGAAPIRSELGFAPFPGQFALSETADGFASTDVLIYP